MSVTMALPEPQEADFPVLAPNSCILTRPQVLKNWEKLAAHNLVSVRLWG